MPKTRLDKDEILELYQHGKEPKEIAKQMECAPQTITNILAQLRKKGLIKQSKRHEELYDLPPADFVFKMRYFPTPEKETEDQKKKRLRRQSVIELYLDGIELEKIAQDLRYAPFSVKAIIREFRIKNGLHTNPIVGYKDEVIRLHEEGLDELEISGQLRRSIQRVQRIIEKHEEEKERKRLKEISKGLSEGLNHEDVGKIGALYRARWSIEKITDEMQKSEEEIKKVLKELGYENV